MYDLILKQVTLVNEGQQTRCDIAITGDTIVKIAPQISAPSKNERNLEGKYLMPGVIDDQVHFRQPGLECKADIASESRAAVAGGVTTFMEMPNTKPPAVTLPELEKKYDVAAQVSPSNYSFFLGATNDNVDVIKSVDPKNVCGVKIFMGSSTGNMLVDNEKALELIFRHSPMLIATHCEDEETIAQNMQYYKAQFGESLTALDHPRIRSREGCWLSSVKAMELARNEDARLHILHISTADETALFRNDIPLTEKKITSEVCVHHLTFESKDYETHGNQIKCNPAIKYDFDREALWTALADDRLDIIATDHAPHTWEEKSQHYLKAPSGVPLIQHTLTLMLEHMLDGRISIERVVEKMCHAPAQCFDVEKRGYIREGYKADMVVFELDSIWTVEKSNLLYKCGWSPLEGREMRSRILSTYVNGQEVYDGKEVKSILAGQRLTFER